MTSALVFRGRTVAEVVDRDSAKEEVCISFLLSVHPRYTSV